MGPGTEILHHPSGPGYDIDEVDAFIDAIRDSFLGVREPSLTPEEIRVRQFSTTRLRPGYDEEEVDAFLDEAESRLAAQVSARRGAPPPGRSPGRRTRRRSRCRSDAWSAGRRVLPVFRCAPVAGALSPIGDPWQRAGRQARSAT